MSRTPIVYFEDECPKCKEENIIVISSEFDKQDRYITTHQYLGNEFQPQMSRAKLVFKKGNGYGIYQCMKCGFEQQAVDDKDLMACSTCGSKHFHKLGRHNPSTLKLQNLLISMLYAAKDLGCKVGLEEDDPLRVAAEKKVMYILRQGTEAICATCPETIEYPHCTCVMEDI